MQGGKPPGAYQLNVDDPASWLESLGGEAPTLLPRWDGDPTKVVVMVTSESTDSGTLDRAVVICTEALFRREAESGFGRARAVYFRVPRDALLAAVTGLDPRSFDR